MATIKDIMSARGKSRSISDIMAPVEDEDYLSKVGREVMTGPATGYRKSLEFGTGGWGDLWNLGADALQAIANSPNLPAAQFIRHGFQSDIDAFREKRKHLFTGRDAQGNITGEFGLPTTEEVQQKITNPAFGVGREAETLPGKIAQGVGENVLGGKKLFSDIVLPAAGAVTGEKVAEAAGVSPTLGRLIGGVGATPTLEKARAGAIGNISPNRAKLVKVLADAGVPLTGGQATGRKALQYAEVGPFSGRAAGIGEQQSRAYTKAVLKHAGIDSDVATPDVLDKARENFGVRYDDIVDRTGGVRFDDQLTRDVVDIDDQFNRLKQIQPGQRTAVNGYLKRISDAADANGGVIPPDVYKTIRSDISRDLRNSSDPELKMALADMQEKLFDSIGRNSGADVVKDWKDLNRQYAAFKRVNRAMRGAGEDTNIEGYIVPAKLRTAMEQANPNFQMDQGELAQLARSGTVMTPMPQSGTTPRNAIVGASIAAAPLWSTRPLTAATIQASPFLAAGAGRALTSKPVRTSIIHGAQTPLEMDPGAQAWVTLQALRDREEGRR